MIESPLIQELEAEFSHKAMRKAKQESILLFLESRFGSVPENIQAVVLRAQDESVLREMTQMAARCPDLDAFRTNLPSSDAKA